MVAGALCLALAVALAQPPAEKASALVNAGIELSHRGRFQEAAAKFVQALALDPKLAEAHYLLGLIRQQDGRADAAYVSFRAALRINTQYAEAQARICELDTAQARARETGYDKASAACQQAVRLDARDPEPHFHLGWNYSKLGNLAAAIKEFETVLKLNPKFRSARFELAMAHADSQDLDLALALLRDVVAAEPANSNARFQLGSALAKKGDCGAALPHLESSTESAQKYYLLAGCLKKVGREDEAAVALEKVKQFREGAEARMQAKLHVAIAHQKAEAGEFESAIAEYRAALGLIADPTVTIDLAVAFLKKGDAAEVVRMLGSEVSPLARYQVALAYGKLGRFDEARVSLESAIAAKPDFVEAWYQLGVMFLALKRPGDADRALSTAVRLRPDDAPIRMAWAQALDNLGMKEQAASERNLAVRQPK